MQRVLPRLLTLLLLASVACEPVTAAPSRARDRITTPEDQDPREDEQTGVDAPAGKDPGGVDGPLGNEPAPDYQDPALDAFIKTQMETSHTPGLSAVIIKDGKVRFAKGYGFASTSKQTPVTVDTIFMLASISKTVAGAALMHLIDSPGAGVTLDDDIATATGFQVRNPAFPNAKITYRHVLTHTAGIANDSVNREVTGDSPIALGGYVQGFLTPQGQYYTRNNFTATAPGATWSYSNPGFATVGFLAQAKSGMTFEAYCQKNIFDPLRMKDTSWRLSGIDVPRVAIPHTWSAAAGYTERAHFGYPDFPAGSLRTTVMQFSSFMRMIIGKGELGTRVLESKTVAEMLKPQAKTAYGDDQGLAWYDTPYKTRHIWGHSGSDPGVTTIMGFDPADGLGAIVFSNGNAYQSSEAETRAFESIFTRLIDTGDKL